MIDKDCKQNEESETLIGPLFFRRCTLAKKGDKVGGHTHTFDHVTSFIRGSVVVKTLDPSCGCEKEIICVPGDRFLTKAEIVHELTALDDDVMFDCIFAKTDHPLYNQ